MIFKKYIILLITLLIICTSKDTLLFGTNGNPVFIILGYILLIFTVFLLLYATSRKRNAFLYPARGGYILGLLSLSILITCILNFDINIKYFYQICLMICGYLYVYLVPFNKFKKIFSDIIVVLSIASIFSFVIYYINYELLNIFPILSNTNGVQYYFTGVSFIPIKVAYTMYRSYGIFREPGMYMVFLNIALMFELFSKKINYKRIIVLSLALLTTLSTAGYLSLFLILIVFISKAKIKIQNKIYFIICVSVVIASILSFIDYEFFFNRIIMKLFDGGSSSDARLDSITINILLLLDNIHAIPFGLGFENVESSFLKKAIEIKSLAGIHNTNTFFKILSVNGFVFFSIYMSSLLLFWRKYYKKEYIALFLIFCILLSNEDMILNCLTYILPFYTFKVNNKVVFKASINEDCRS